MNRKKGKELNISFMKNRKGLSSVVIALILIVISLVAIGLIWFVVRSLISASSKQIGGLSSGLTIDLSISNAFQQNGNITVDVKRNVGAGNLVAIKFILSDDINSEIITKNTTMQELEEDNFVFTPIKLAAANVVKVSVAPVFKATDGTETTGSITDTFYLSNGHIVTTETGITNGTSSGGTTTSYCGDGVCGTGENCSNCAVDCGSCACPHTCAQLGLQCGYNPYCGNSCGTCTMNYACTNGICVAPNCVPESQTTTCGTWTCGSRVNNCGALINCGSCGTRQMCENGICTAIAPLNTGTVGDTWPGTAAMYFGSPNLPTDPNITYQGDYIKFPSPSAETDCLLIAIYKLNSTGYQYSHIGFNFPTLIKTGDPYEIFSAIDLCQSY